MEERLGGEGWGVKEKEEEEEGREVAPVVGCCGLVALFRQGFFGSPSCRLSEQDESRADEVTAKRRDPPPPGTRTMPARQG